MFDDNVKVSELISSRRLSRFVSKTGNLHSFQTSSALRRERHRTSPTGRPESRRKRPPDCREKIQRRNRRDRLPNHRTGQLSAQRHDWWRGTLGERWKDQDQQHPRSSS